MSRNVISAIILIATIVLAVVCYILIFTNFEEIWFNFNAIFYLCLTTFLAGVGIFVSAIIVERKTEKKE